MMFPSVFGENLFDDWMDDFGFRDNFFGGKNPLYGKHAKNIMKTDVRETDKGYELDVDLPGFKKDEVQVQLKDGYLTISAAKGLDKDEEDKKGNYITSIALSAFISMSSPIFLYFLPPAKRPYRYVPAYAVRILK